MKKDPFKNLKLSKSEQWMEDHSDEFVPSPKELVDKIAAELERRKKNAVLNIRINQGDLDHLKAKAKKLGLKYQTFIAEILHKVAHS